MPGPSLAGQLAFGFAGRESPDVSALVRRNALFAVNHSGGKDSQAMTLALADMGVPASQMLVIHAPLGKVEWPGTVAHIRATMPDAPLVFAPVASGKGLLDRVEERGMFPDPGRRWCTSDFKRGPIEREIRRWLGAHPEHGGLVVNCLGMRADESPGRSRLPAWSRSARNSRAGREWHDWLPIHGWSVAEVFGRIEAAGQKPHWAYAAGMSRLSCSFCIMASRADLATAARLRPDLYREYVALEERLGHTLSLSRVPLVQLTGVAA